ncbi:MAG: DJ-1/PfpI family protein [Planctomycetes bacterium]|nr:DJ-1/PfpI family protein [Planctomycetota bacterium]
MEKTFIFVICGSIFSVIFVSCAKKSDGTGNNQDISLAGKNILMVIAPKDFRDEELFIPKEYFEKNKATVVVASSQTGTVIGMKGGKAEPDILLKDVDASGYDAVVFVGGSGAKVYFDDATAQGIALKAVENDKILAAICLAPSILANAGILRNRKATVFKSETDNLKANDVKYADQTVVRDGSIITGNGPDAAMEFAQEISKALAGK